MNSLTPEVVTVMASVVLSLLFSYVPGLRAKFDVLSKEQKQLVMLALILAVTGGTFAAACAGFSADLNLSLTCDRKSAVDVLMVIIAAVTANQGTFLITPKFAGGRGTTEDVR